MKLVTACIALLLPSLLSAQRPASPDSAAIRAAALDYIEGWYTGDSVRMRRAVHGSLAKRIPMPPDATGRMRVQSMTADALVRGTGSSGGQSTPVAARIAEYELLALDGTIATVRLRSAEFIDYMHLARIDGAWKIVNVLWDYRDESRPKQGPMPAAMSITSTQFKSLSWLTGNFIGTGTNIAFYESYRFVNDSTMEIGHYRDSTFTQESGPRGRIELRGGRVVYENAVVTSLSESSVRFDAAPVGTHYFTFQRGAAAGLWTATIEGQLPNGQQRKTVYSMRVK